MNHTPESYRELRRHIDEPLPVVLPPGPLVTGGDVPVEEDAEWPAPTDYASIITLMRRFDVRSVQRILCAVTAVESVLPVWEAELAEQDDIEHADNLRGAIDSITRWLRFRQAEDARAAGQFARRAVQVAAHFGDRLGPEDAHRGETTLNAADAVDQAAEATWHLADNGGRDNSCAAGAIWRATLACCGADPEAAARFLHHWWAHCRKRLAWADATTSEIKGESFRTTAVPDQRP